MIDLHTHILPAIDDGVQSEDEAVEFARVALRDGIHTIVATPHCREGFFVNQRSAILEGVARLRERLAAEQVPVEVLPGAEVHLCPDLLQRIEEGWATTLADNRKVLLLELSLTQVSVELENLVFQLKLAGIDTLFAHPERIRHFQEDVSRYARLIDLGAYGQLTSGSVLGDFGSVAREFSEELLRRGLVHVLASDGHNVRGRSPLLSEARKAIVPLVGERRAASMTDAVPAALLAGRTPEIPPVEGTEPRRTSFFSRLFRRDPAG